MILSTHVTGEMDKDTRNRAWLDKHLEVATREVENAPAVPPPPQGLTLVGGTELHIAARSIRPH